MSEWINVGIQQGWQCPICKRVYAPFMPMCTYCGTESEKQTNTPNDGVWVKSGRKCKCGGDMLWNSRVVLTSYPAQYEYLCEKCGNKEYEFVSAGRPDVNFCYGGSTKLEEMAKLGVLGWSQAGPDDEDSYE